MTSPNPITTPLLLALALLVYAHRHRNDPPFAQQWYRGCGWFPSAESAP